MFVGCKTFAFDDDNDSGRDFFSQESVWRVNSTRSEWHFFEAQHLVFIRSSFIHYTLIKILRSFSVRSYCAHTQQISIINCKNLSECNARANYFNAFLYSRCFGDSKHHQR